MESENQKNKYKPQLKIYNCLLCGWNWASRRPEKPKSCARCKSRNWETGKKTIVNKYGFDQLAVGEEKFFPWILNGAGKIDQRANANRLIAVRQYSRRSGRQFYASGTYKDRSSYFMVRRIS